MSSHPWGWRRNDSYVCGCVTSTSPGDNRLPLGETEMTLSNHARFLDSKAELIMGTGFSLSPGDFLDRGCWPLEHCHPPESESSLRMLA